MRKWKLQTPEVRTERVSEIEPTRVMIDLKRDAVHLFTERRTESGALLPGDETDTMTLQDTTMTPAVQAATRTYLTALFQALRASGKIGAGTEEDA